MHPHPNTRTYIRTHIRDARSPAEPPKKRKSKSSMQKRIDHVICRFAHVTLVCLLVFPRVRSRAYVRCLVARSEGACIAMWVISLYYCPLHLPC
ncbi:hypothetical protein COCSADRAFT_239830 [Bipolaris sorokiniana ND90Pr]|uniref:Uncharacterized protein n=1 Tax=Cochliobolus sativus (strain ND90Pr / ATCC 201652) TaxID=665912 RepID=M2SVZ0_COCSN|nr:uncharacterized protein COCSADRAFT_239830 [Bipolaris sorokiniana ND90Pr]EMD61166.1 hypothetical protein COCSADRAFT_239830 [Bipolaris sorokiniana ND90Pr]